MFLWKQCWVSDWNLNQFPLGFCFIWLNKLGWFHVVVCRGQLGDVLSFETCVELLSCILKFLFCHCLVSTAFIPNFFFTESNWQAATRHSWQRSWYLQCCVKLLCWSYLLGQGWWTSWLPRCDVSLDSCIMLKRPIKLFCIQLNFLQHTQKNRGLAYQDWFITIALNLALPQLLTRSHLRSNIDSPHICWIDLIT